MVGPPDFCPRAYAHSWGLRLGLFQSSSGCASACSSPPIWIGLIPRIPLVTSQSPHSSPVLIIGELSWISRGGDQAPQKVILPKKNFRVRGGNGIPRDAPRVYSV